jgi:hypothetical protein
MTVARDQMKSLPTPYTDINQVLGMLLVEVSRVLDDQFVGLYLYGSLAGGDFNLATSDLDFLVVTSSALGERQIKSLEAMHTRLLSGDKKWIAKLEGSYLPLSALPRFEPDGPAYPTLNECRFYMAPHGPDWVLQRHVLREQGVIVAGPPIKPWIDPVEPEALRHAVIALLETWWAPMIDHPSRLQNDAYQAYAVLSMCRARFTLAHGELVSKPRAANWAQRGLREDQVQLIERALAWRPGETLDALDQVTGLIRDTLVLSRALQALFIARCGVRQRLRQ